jgi:hypothetical protein
MTPALRLIYVNSAAGLDLVAFFSPAAASGPHDLAADWLPPTPAEAKRFLIVAGDPLRGMTRADALAFTDQTTPVKGGGAAPEFNRAIRVLV